MTRLSVIMSVYNGEEYLEKAIVSILTQSFIDFEFIIFDDASTDGSKKIIETFAANDSRIFPVYHPKNKGLTKNLNAGIEISKGDYIARMDADDLSYPARFETQINFLDEHPEIDLVGSSAVVIDNNGNALSIRSMPKFHEEICSMLPKANPITHPTVMFRKDSLAKINFYNEKYPIIQDYEMWFRATGKGLKFFNIQEPLLAYRMDNNYVKRRSMSYRWCDFKLRVKSYPFVGIPYFRYYYALIPLLLGLIPKQFYPLIKKTDPRVKKLN